LFHSTRINIKNEIGEKYSSIERIRFQSRRLKRGSAASRLRRFHGVVAPLLRGGGTMESRRRGVAALRRYDLAAEENFSFRIFFFNIILNIIY